MTDRELLEKAAKAAGLQIDTHSPTGGCWVFDPAGEEDADGNREYFDWNPLTDDGDALRLAVKLGMEVYIDDHPEGCACSEARSVTHDGGTAVYSHGAGDPYAATRRAIVRAAAAIGEQA